MPRGPGWRPWASRAPPQPPGAGAANGRCLSPSPLPFESEAFPAPGLPPSAHTPGARLLFEVDVPLFTRPLPRCRGLERARSPRGEAASASSGRPRSRRSRGAYGLLGLSAGMPRPPAILLKAALWGSEADPAQNSAWELVFSSGWVSSSERRGSQAQRKWKTWTNSLTPKAKASAFMLIMYNSPAKHHLGIFSLPG